ncbi:hypothetical protein CDAR_24311 [Caerostris darwini]|uniref:Uncharacterized protein n=1 Tax=Caerostris darwini TaxID=1538125 RepID=A0AAV4QKN3_9ARAC|nr:hypothetical protein CDAR_24311 [Caerostris darwini]
MKIAPLNTKPLFNEPPRVKLSNNSCGVRCIFQESGGYKTPAIRKIFSRNEKLYSAAIYNWERDRPLLTKVILIENVSLGRGICDKSQEVIRVPVVHLATSI